MPRLNYERPYFRLLDNLRRELGAYPILSPESPLELDWPQFLRPIAANPKAMRALFDLIESIDKWFSDEVEAISLSNPPQYVIQAYKSFSSVRVVNKYDNRFSGNDWLNSKKQHPTDDDALRPLLLELLKHVQPQ